VLFWWFLLSVAVPHFLIRNIPDPPINQGVTGHSRSGIFLSWGVKSGEYSWFIPSRKWDLMPNYPGVWNPSLSSGVNFPFPDNRFGHREFMRGKAGRAVFASWSITVINVTNRRPWAHDPDYSQPTVKRVEELHHSAHHPTNDRMAEAGRTTVRNIAHPKAIYGRLPCRYPILSTLMSRETE